MKCESCFRGCLLEEGQTGFCKGRWMKDGKIVPKNYGLLTAYAIDPIEKKPLYHFCPGSVIDSVGSFGCNMHCSYCQNHQISQNDLSYDSYAITPEQLVDKVLENQKIYGSIGLAFTYNEPLIYWEFVRDTFILAKEKGLKTVLVTNGCASQVVIDAILPYTDALNIDMKVYSHQGYQKLGGDFYSVKRNIEKASKQAHVEICYLVLEGFNDDEEEFSEMVDWLARLDENIPLHINRYFPRYKESAPATRIETLNKLEQIALKKLKHVHIGNV
jgi:pyruvate formate lyase activating enzyme